MLGFMMHGIERKVADAARKVGLVTASAVLTCVGAAFLTVAAWIYLSSIHSSGFAALILGCVYVGAGVIMLAVALSRKPPPAPLQAQDGLSGLSPMQLVVLSFMQGLEQGRNAKPPK